MKSRWDEEEAPRFAGDLAQRVYTSRLLGRDPSLVLHGGGNTSVKVRERNLFDQEECILYVKGRGGNLATIEPSGFSPCRLEHLLRLTALEVLTDSEMENELRVSMIRSSAPTPSVETLLHAILPGKFVDHTHSDALLSVMNSPDGETRVRRLYGDRVVIVPYVMPGFRLAQLCRELWRQHGTTETIGMALMHHGLFTQGDTARTSYERMIELVDRAESHLAEQNAWFIEWSPPAAPSGSVCAEIAALRGEVSHAAGAPMVMTTHADPQALGFARLAQVRELSQRGPATPDHVIRTKRVPLVGRDVNGYCAAYRHYVQSCAEGRALPPVDPAPRVILDPQLGMCTIGRTAHDAAIAEDIYRHTMDVMLRAERLGGWEALPARDYFDVEFWQMERAKLAPREREGVFTGEVALVTGAASGIGKACADALLARGATVVGLDIAAGITTLHAQRDFLGIACDVTSEPGIEQALERAVSAFGGLDLLILNAGTFPRSAPIASLSGATWRSVMGINLDANLTLLRQCHPLLKLAPRGGRVVIIGSKNVLAPGPGAAAYSASKAALQQLARVAALEWGEDRIRVNTLHPNAVFDTGIWTPEVLASRAASYGLTVDEYKTNNVLKVEVTSRDVAELAAELCGPLFAKTTGAQIPVDGGNTRII